MNNKIAYKRVNFEKMRVQRIYLEEEIFRFKEEIANVQRQMELQTMKRVYRKDEQVIKSLLYCNPKPNCIQCIYYYFAEKHKKSTGIGKEKKEIVNVTCYVHSRNVSIYNGYYIPT